MKPLIVHVAQVEVTEATGMGRVAWHWQKEFERRGYDFIHIGRHQVGSLPHGSLFPYAAYRAYKKLNRRAAVLLVHEPAAGIFARRTSPTVVVSHGIERRRWQLALEGKDGATTKVRMRSKLFYPLWRLRQCDVGLREAAKLLLINNEDAAFVQNHYRRQANHLHVYKNGVYPSSLSEETQPKREIRVLFLGVWMEGKGINTLIEAAHLLHARGVRVHWLLAGTRADDNTVLSSWARPLHSLVENVPEFSRDTEESLFARSNFFVLPSFCEGQPLSLLQAMESGRCCITTNCCGQRELIRHNYNGLLHAPGDAQHLASLIEQAMDDENLRKSLGRMAKETVRGRSWEAVSSEVVDLLEGIMHPQASLAV
jgi:glycosyltransferase involved in cell wall biosynthesis